MAMVVKNNMSAVRTLNTLNKNSAALQKSLAKVSSGMKINSAQDDASGYAISERMRVQIRSLDQANQNTQNASSLMKTAEGAVSSTVEILKTLKEKAINAATDTNTDADRATIQKELDQFIDQIDDNALTTFNGKYLVDGSKSASGTAVATAMTNQSLDENTDGSTALTALKNRNGESLEISSTDFVTASYVMNGSTYTTKFKISDHAKAADTSLNDVFTALNDVKGPEASASKGPDAVEGAEGGETSKDLYAKVEDAVKAVNDALAKNTSYTGGSADIKKAVDDYVATYTAKGADDKITVPADHKAGTSYTNLGGSDKGTVDNIIADTDVAKALTDAKTAVDAYNAKVDEEVAAADAKKTAADKYSDLEKAATALKTALTTAGMDAADKTAVEKVIDDSLTKDADNKDNVTAATAADITSKLTNTGSGTKTTITADIADDTKDLGKAYKAYTDAVAAYNTKATAEADAAAAGGGNESEGVEGKGFSTDGVKSGTYIGQSAADDPVNTADGTKGLTIRGANAGLGGQISGLTISITDSEGNVKKSANAALDAFKTTIYAKNASSNNEMSFQVGANANQSISVSLNDMRSEALGLKGRDGVTKVSVATQDKANAAVAVFDNAIQKVLDQQATIGAIESRLEYTSQNLTTSSENVQAAESTIRDADMAKEMTTYTKNNVLLQAAQSMLAQANQNSSAVLSLLQ